MSKRELNILLIEDSSDDAELIERTLKRAGMGARLTRVETADEFEQQIAVGSWDAIIADNQLPGFSAGEALSRLRAADRVLPFILVSGAIGEETVTTLLHAGADDYVSKESLVRLPRAVKRALREREEARARLVAEERASEGHHQFKSIFEMALDPILITKDRAVLEANEAACTMLKVPRADLLGRDILEFVQLSEEQLADLRETYERHGTLRGEARVRAFDGEMRDVAYSARANVVPGKHLSFLRDITEQKTMIRELERSRADLAEAQRLARIGSYTIDPDTRQVELSAEASRLLGIGDGRCSLTWDEALERVSERDRPYFETFVENAITAGRSSRYQGRIVRPDGDVRIMRGRITVAESDGRHLSAVIQDVTEEVEAERRSATLQSKLDRAVRLESLGQLAGGVAHDFNNLLGVIMNYAELAKGEIESPEVRADLDAILEAAQRGADLTRRLLTFGRAEPAQRQPLDLNQIVEKSTALLRRGLDESIDLDLDLALGLWPVVADPVQLDQVVMNLAVNARDAMADGGTLLFRTRNLEIESSAQSTLPLRAGRYTVLEAVDSGCGMSGDVAERAFDPFFSTKSPGEGTGLGLATVFGVAVDAGGHVDIESSIGRGTRVSVFLPAAPDAEIRGSNLHSETSGHSAEGQQVLLVEDEAPLLRLATRLLEQSGFEVTPCGDPADALATDRKPDVVLTDIVMPGLNGTDLAVELKRRWPDVEVVFTSGYTDRPGRLPRDARFLPKPYSKEDLVDAVSAAAKGART